MKNLLISTGIPQGGTVTGQKIGPLPNVKNAILKLESGSKGKTESLPSLAVKIYPNPSTTYIAIQSNEDKSSILKLSIFRKKCSKNSVSSDEKIDISQLPRGQYIININEGARRVVEKFTKL
jgi:hypothetical protein